MADANMYIMNPVFQAESFNEMVQPLALYAQAYKEQEAKVEDMTDKASALEWIANQNPDSQTAALYRDMSNKIKGIRDDMMMNGLTGGLRSRILGTRRIYSANSSEITRRYEDMVKYRDRMAALQDKDPSMVFSADSWDVDIDDFAGGKRPKIKAISGNEIMARGAAVGKRLTSQIFGDGVLGQEMGGQFWKVYQSQGMDDTALWNALQAVGQANESKFNMAKQVIDGVYSSFKDFAPGDQMKLKNRFIEGVYSGSVYNKQVDYKNNEDHLNPLQLAQKQATIDENKRAQEKWDYEKVGYQIAAGEPFTAPDGKTYQYNPVNNTYVEAETKKVIPAPTDPKTGKTAKSSAKAKVVAIDESGQKINVTDNTALGTVMKTGTPELRKEWNEVWAKIQEAHPDIQPGEYRLRKYVEESSGEGNKKKKKVRYYAEPVINSSSSDNNSNNSSDNKKKPRV